MGPQLLFFLIQRTRHLAHHPETKEGGRKLLPEAGFEPTISRSESKCLRHSATAPHKQNTVLFIYLVVAVAAAVAAAVVVVAAVAVVVVCLLLLVIVVVMTVC